jgi:hypothetical protein
MKETVIPETVVNSRRLDNLLTEGAKKLPEGHKVVVFELKHFQKKRELREEVAE